MFFSKMIRIAISTLGCKVNQAESASIISQFDLNSYTIVEWGDEADIYIINSCTVTNRTDYKSRYLIRQALSKKAINPLVKVIVTGCFAQRSEKEIYALGEVDYVVDNQQKLNIASILKGLEFQFADIMEAKTFSFAPVSKMQQHTRAFQKIQDGCDFYCSYCAVPYARGHSRSATLQQVIQQARLFADCGYKEIVLGGVNLGLYLDGSYKLADVVESIANIQGIEIIRLSSIEPQLFSNELIIRLKAISKVCPHFHIPLQSGSNAILNSMKRHYNTDLVRELVNKIEDAFPNSAIGFDVITGYPGESELHHKETVDFLATLPLAYLHVFSYSMRKDTPAALMPNQIMKAEKINRSRQLQKLSDTFKKKYQERCSQGNVTLRGVVEKQYDGRSEFLSDHFLRVQIPRTVPIGDFVTTSFNDVLVIND
ncbi:MAG: tRNA (N(6)-L-threonylcarbamoyladenosine(37)-C(2))-methylthiotransferase MtaB [Candidatus Cloacimonetes bacterium]|nr:tRNA (N(6)-L-threonylcarbamoyladenosine(37)-C(2))-methylthiotransferase MtaB [Candidatus Cloacimonadota bacterium]